MSNAKIANVTAMHSLLRLLFLIRISNAFQEFLQRIEEDEYDGGGENLVYLGRRVFQNPNAESGRKLKKWNDTWDINPEEMGNYVEGDIAFPPEMEKNGLIIEAARWPNATVPYEIEGDFSTNEIGIIKKVMKLYMSKTCIKFRPKQPTDEDWVKIRNSETGCWSSVGRKGGPQIVNLQSPQCLVRMGTVIHEFLHVVGFIHQQSTWDRNKYVKVEWENIQEGMEINFIRRSRHTVTSFGVPYDYGSVMHYSGNAFSSNGNPTLVPKAHNANIGQRWDFSPSDIKKVLLMYKCIMYKHKRRKSKSGSSGKENHAYITLYLSYYFICSLYFNILYNSI